MVERIDIDDAEMVRRMIAGDEEAFEVFSDSYLAALYRFASNRLSGDRDLTREIVQSTVCKVVANLASFRGEAALLTWMSSICRNEIAMHFRRQRRRPREVEWTTAVEAAIETSRGSTDADIEESLIEDEHTNLVHMVLDLLPAHYAQALEWKYLDDLSVKEIATRMEIGVKAAESMLTRARQSFRSHYDRYVDSLVRGSGASASSPRRAVLES